MKILCPSCRVPVAADDVNLASGLAKCRTCNNVFRITDVAPELAAPAARLRDPVGKPGSVVTSESPAGLTIEYRWFSAKYVFLAFFCLFWDGFLVFWYAMALGTGNVIMAVFPVIHVAVGVALTYTTVAGFVNQTTVTLDRSRLRVKHHPLPFGKPVDVETGGVKQLFCQEKVNSGRNGVSYSYDLMVEMRDGSRRKLLSGIDTPQLPLYLEQHAEAWMGISDAPVPGELPR
jgi:uncharacterized protein YbaR (Trm112 family)